MEENEHIKICRTEKLVNFVVWIFWKFVARKKLKFNAMIKAPLRNFWLVFIPGPSQVGHTHAIAQPF